MATYFATARSNYFRVKDAEAFETLCEEMGLEMWESEEDEGRFAVSGEEHGWPSMAELDEDDPRADEDGEWEFDVFEEISKHLVDGEVAVFMEAGNEAMRYVNGYAVAVNSKGETRSLRLNDILDLAKELTDRPDDITECSY